MQALYAYMQQENNDTWIAQKEMLSASERTYDLYLQLLLLLPEMVHHENMHAKDAPKKQIGKTKNALNKLSENEIVKFLQTNFLFNDRVKKRGLGWGKDADLMSRIFLTLRMSELYKEYVMQEEITIEMQIKFFESFYKDQIFNNEVFIHEMEDKNLFWAESFEMISPLVVKTITSFDKTNRTAEIMPMYRDTDEDIEFMKKLFNETIKNDKWFTELISEKTQNWDVDRIALMDVILLKMALSEVVAFDNIPVKVTINEYLDISKVYSTPKSKVFINGIIDKLVIDLKSAEKIHKKGRGLLDK